MARDVLALRAAGSRRRRLDGAGSAPQQAGFPHGLRQAAAVHLAPVARLSALRLAALTQSALFAAFTVFWTILAFRLAEPRFGYGAQVAGLFGLVGAVGILAAPLAGRFADRRGPSQAVILGVLVTLAAWLVFGFWTSLPGLVLGVVLLDFGMQTALVSNQHIVFALHPEARARLNTVLMGTMFLGGALGSALATLVWQAGGWFAVSVLGIGFAVAATVLQALAWHQRT